MIERDVVRLANSLSSDPEAIKAVERRSAFSKLALLSRRSLLRRVGVTAPSLAAAWGRGDSDRSFSPDSPLAASCDTWDNS